VVYKYQYPFGGIAVGITVRDALKLGGLKKGRVIGGFEGLDNTVRYVSVLEITDDQVADPALWYRGDELMISALYSVRDDVSAQVKQLERIAACGCAGLVLCHEGIYLKEISPELINAADRLKIPLIVVPKEIGYIDIINPVLEEVISIQKEELEYALNVQNKMTDLILEGTGLKKVASEISKILQCPFLIVDSEHRILTKGYHNQKGSSLLNEVINNKQLCEELLESDKENPVQINNCQCFNIPVRSGKNVFGKLLLFRGRPFEKLELVAIDEISKAVMLILTQKIAKKEEMLRAQREFLDELLSGSIQDEEMALSRAEYFKIKVPHKIMAMVIETTKPHQQNTKSKRSEGYLKSKQNEIIKTIDSIMKYKINYLATTRGNLVIVLMEAGEDTEALAVHQAKEIGEKLAKEITAKIDNLDVFIAIGEQYDKLTKIHKSLGEALKTIQLGKILFNSVKCVHVTDLGVYYYLPELLSNENISGYITSTTSALKEYDAVKNMNLMDTFKLLLFEEDVGKVADSLFIHRNTLLYRKEKIKKILGVDPFIQPNKLNYQLTIILAQLKEAKDG
jgi:purine catabolism regulator